MACATTRCRIQTTLTWGMTATHTAIAQTDGSETNAEAVQTYVWTGCQNGTFVSPQPDLWRLQPHRMPCVQCQTTQATTHARNSSCRRLGRWQEASGSAVSAQVSSGSLRSRVQFTPTIAPPGAISSVLCDALGGGRAGATRIVVDVDYDNATATAASAFATTRGCEVGIAPDGSCWLPVKTPAARGTPNILYSRA